MKRKRVGIAVTGFTPYPNSENIKNPTIIRVGDMGDEEESTIDHSSDDFSGCIDSMEQSKSSNSSLEPVDMSLKNGLLKSAAPVKNVFVIPDEKMKGICTDSVKPLSNFCSRPRTNIDREIGEPSCCYCVICGDAKPVMSTIRSHCKHRYCVDCFQVYVAERLNEENISSVKCPEKKCKMELGHEFWGRYVPEEVYDRKKLGYLESSCLAFRETIKCPYCHLGFVDDRRFFLIRACTNCWAVMCMNCMVRWHLGMTCREFQARRLRQVAFLESSTNSSRRYY